MITIPLNTNYRFKFPVIDQDTGKFVTGLSITYTINKSSDGTLIDTDTCTEEGTTGVYYFDYTYIVAQEYDIIITTPVGYFDGVETVLVEETIQTELTNYDTTKGNIVKQEIQQSTDTIVEKINKATSQPIEKKSRPYKW